MFKLKKSVIAISLLLGLTCITPASVASTESVMKEKVSYPQTYTNIKLVAEVYKPADFNPAKKYPAIVVVHPAGGVKEQVAGLYAQKLAELGFITVAYDSAYQGESEGEPRFLENPSSRVDDVYSSVDYLTMLPYVDPNRIGALGICAGGGYAVHATETDMRIQAVATVSAFDLGRARRQGFGDTLSLEQQQAKLKDAAVQRNKELHGEPVKYNHYVPDSLAEIGSNASLSYKQGYEYYRTDIAKHPRSQNKYIFSNYAQQAAFTAFDRPELISPRPVLFIVGSNADSAYFSKDAFDKAREPKEYMVVDGATHIDMYYKTQYVEQAVKRLGEFYKKSLGSVQD